MIHFFFNDTATTEIYTLSLHDALPISTLPAATPPSKVSRRSAASPREQPVWSLQLEQELARVDRQDRKSTRLNSSHANISYAVFCLNKKILLRSTIRSPRSRVFRSARA